MAGSQDKPTAAPHFIHQAVDFLFDFRDRRLLQPALHVDGAGGPVAGVGFALASDPFIYEVVVLCRRSDRRLLDGLTRMLVDLRLGSGLSLVTP